MPYQPSKMFNKEFLCWESNFCNFDVFQSIAGIILFNTQNILSMANDSPSNGLLSATDMTALIQVPQDALRLIVPCIQVVQDALRLIVYNSYPRPQINL